MRRHHILILCAALIAVLPLLAFGCSCGHDIDFHIQSWLDAAQQLRHGTLYPHWIFSAAWNAGEPRFIFYPPLSWMFGALLTFIIPTALLPATYTFICLAAAGLAMHHLARHFVPPNAALLAATLYIVNPYMLFNAFERTAYAELLAAAWLPLLLLATLRARPTVRGIALPVALLWLTNAPAAVMGSYTLALIIIVRIVYLFAKGRGAPRLDSETWASAPPLNLALTSIAGTTLGLALPAFYLIPAAYERRFVQIAMAIIPNMRFQDNFLFGHTADADHNRVLHTASLIALALLIATTAAVLALLFRNSTNVSSRPERSAVERPASPPATAATAIILTILTLCISFLVTPTSTPLWNHLPELAFLQFPWRLLSVLAVVLALAIALLLRNAPLGTMLTIPTALILVVAFTFFGIHEFRQSCDPDDLPTTRAQAFAAHHGVDPTDEYTPNNADNDTIRADDPPYWLSPNPSAFAPNTTPNPQTLITPPLTPPDTKFSIAAPTGTVPFSTSPIEFTFNASQRETLIINLRDYPNWDLRRGGEDSMEFYRYQHIQRDDGLIALEVPAGVSTIRITWHRTLDEQLGLLISILAVGIYASLILFTGGGKRDVQAAGIDLRG
jgi:hypothetical protein